tara:strand:- start:129 stop:890 length:762 start_codon:yes stop_codon:yes gene_type:complete
MTKAIILCGGYGTRISEETHKIPKPMIKLDKSPILLHILSIYSKYNIKDFIICVGYKGEEIINFFKKHEIKRNLVKFNLSKLNLSAKKNHHEIWKIKIVKTGLNTLTGGRILRIKKYVDKEKFFHITYGDGVSDINISKLEKFFISNKLNATLTAVKEPSRFGRLNINNNKVKNFIEKPNEYINGGFFIFNQSIFNYLKDDNTILEKDPLEKLSKKNKLYAYKHNGFWHPMDTLRDKINLEKFCKNMIPIWLK